MGSFFSKMGKPSTSAISSMKSVKAVKVTALNDAKTLEIDFNNGKIKKTFKRPVDELLLNTLARIKCSLGNQKKKKKSKVDWLKQLEDGEKTNTDMVITVLDSNKQEIPQSMLGLQVWKIAHFLNINNETYDVLFNPPSVTKLALTTKPMAEIPILPMLHFNMAYANQSAFTWFKSVDKYEEIEKMDYSNSNGESRKRRRSGGEDDFIINENDLDLKDPSLWVEVSKENIYTPAESDIGHVIKLEVMPGNESYPTAEPRDGIETVAAKSGVVCSGPDSCIFDARHLLTEKHCSDPDKFRMITYNILADCYANTDFALSSLFPYCSKQHIDINYRIQLLLKEIIGYHGDIICLQEVDRFVFEDFLAPAMSFNNFAAAFANKNNTKEGVALFYNRAKFKLVSVENKVLQTSLSKDDVHSNLRSFVNSCPKLQSRVNSLGSCALLSVLQSLENPSKYLVVVNTHLYYHPHAGNIRLVQILVILNLLRSKLLSLKESLDKESTVSYILCGDLNSKTRTALVEFLLTGNLPHNHADWYSGGIEEFHGTTTSFNHDFNFKSACGFPAYTNYACGFSECLDYIFIDSDQLKVDRVIDNPEHKLVVEYSALPSVSAPSDHIAQITNLNWL